MLSADVVNENSVDVIDECSIPDFGVDVIYDFPECKYQSLGSKIQRPLLHKARFDH